MATRTPPLQERSSVHAFWGVFPSATFLPNASGAPLPPSAFVLEAGDTAYSIADGTLFVCTGAGTPGGGNATWSSLGGSGGGPSGALPQRAYIPVGAGSSLFTTIGVPVFAGSTTVGRTFNPASAVYRERQLRAGIATNVVANNAVAVWSTRMFAGTQRPKFRFTQSFGGTAFATARYLAALVDVSLQMWASTQEPSSQVRSLFGVGFDSGDANLQIMHNDGVGACSKVDLGAGFARSADLVVRAEFDWSTPGQIDYEITRLDAAATASGSLVTDIPADTVALAYNTQVSNDAAGGNVGNVDLIGFYANIED